MKAYYINLESALARRDRIERAFSGPGTTHLQLVRVPAVDVAEVAARAVPGAIRDAEKACVLSHAKALGMSRSDDSPSLILEDDATIGPKGLAALQKLDLVDWTRVDLAFTSSLIANVDLLLTQYLAYRSSMKSGKVQLFDVARLHFAGTDGYVVGDRGREKLLQLLAAASASLDRPYDLLLKEWIRSGLLRAVVVFPFLTTVSTLADESAITTPNPDWNAFRRLMCIDSEHFRDDAAMDDASRKAAVRSFTDEYLKFVRIFLTEYYEP